MKITDLIEQGGVGVVAVNKQQAKDLRYSTSMTADVKPGETAKQAAKFGNKLDKKGMPPLLREDSVTDLKKAVVKQVNATTDAEMLDRIYTVLNRTNLQDRIQGVISKETDAKKYADVIADIVINTPGSYQEKYAFIDKYPDGYINVDKLIGGTLVSFNDLITDNEFAKKVFNKLFTFTPESAGPGEFALAALSPRIKMRSKGDLYIDNEYIEVKSSAGKEVSSGGGRLGEPGLLNPSGVKELIERYTKNKIQGDVYIHQLHGLLAASIKDNAIIKQAATDIIKTIFGYSDKDLINAVVSGSNQQQAYVKANWKKYQEEAGWVGLLLLNRAGASARLFTNPEQTSDSIYSINAAIVSKDVAKASRQILSQVTLRGAGKPAANAATVKTNAAPSDIKSPVTSEPPPPSKGDRAKRSSWHKAYKDQPQSASSDRKKR